jgi:transposase-like protein
MSPRRFAPEFKRKVVQEHLQEGKRIAEICREHQISDSLFRRWREQYLADGQRAFTPQDEVARKLRESERRVEELEAALGRSAMEVDFLRRAFQRAGLPFPKEVRS